MPKISDIEQQFQVKGLRTPVTEDDHLRLNFFAIVQGAAAAQGKIFYFWSYEGNDILTDDLDGGDMSGWLVSPEKADEFEKAWKVSDQLIPDDLYEGFTIARWSESSAGNIQIAFE